MGAVVGDEDAHPALLPESGPGYRPCGAWEAAAGGPAARRDPAACEHVAERPRRARDRRRGRRPRDDGRQCGRRPGPRPSSARSPRSQPSDRAVQAVWSGVPAQSNLSYRQLDRLARNALEPVLHHPAFAVEVFRQATWGGAFVNLGAVDGVSRWLVLRSGRLPRACTPTRLRARADRRQAGRAEAALPARRRQRDLPRRLAAVGVLRRRGIEPAADPARRRRLRVHAHAASGRAAHRAHVRLGRPARAGIDPRLGSRQPRHAHRPRAVAAGGEERHLLGAGAARHDRERARDEPRRGRAPARPRRRRRRPAARIRRARVDATSPRLRRDAAPADLVRRAARPDPARRRSRGRGDHDRRERRRLDRRQRRGRAARAASRRAGLARGRPFALHAARVRHRCRARCAHRARHARRAAPGDDRLRRPDA